MAAEAVSGPLRQLARLYGVQTSYQDIFQKQRDVTRDALLAVLWSLGAPLGGEEDIQEALVERRRSLWGRIVPPTAAAWLPDQAYVTVRTPIRVADSRLHLRLTFESGERRDWAVDIARSPSAASHQVNGQRYIAQRVRLPSDMPPGYHRLEVDAGNVHGETLVIAAPQTAYVPPSPDGDAMWGVFIPLYALRSARSWGAGDFTDLEHATEWVAGLGGNVVATLPLLPAFLDGNPFEYSPYSPVSRLFWNEFYVDPMRAREWALSTAARVEWATPEMRREIAALRALPQVDYRRQMAAKRRVLEPMARSFFSHSARGQRDMGFTKGDTAPLEDYARFRAVTEKHGAPWRVWPERQRSGNLRPGDYDDDAFQYYLYAQSLAQEQMRSVKESASRSRQQVYLDLPVGVHPDGYDVWRYRESFAVGMSVGAPPDDFFTLGQDWGFQPIHPERERIGEYRYFIASLRHHLQAAGVLRIDHVMQFHRLFWIPNGFSARDGVYVRYPANDFFAILALESQRHRAMIIGENLGTVPPIVNETLVKRRIHRLFVSQFSTHPDLKEALPPVTQDTAASLNTHDTPTFAAFWQGGDIGLRVAMGWMAPDQALEEQKGRTRMRRMMSAYFGAPEELSTRGALRGFLGHLASSAARIVLVALEDLWQEERPQNLPGAGMEQPNWRRKARFPIEDFSQDAEVVSTLKSVDTLRKGRSFRHDYQIQRENQ